MRASYRRNLKRTGLALLAIFLLPLILIIIIAFWLLGTDTGGHWLLKQAPGLSQVGFEGRLGGEWQAERLEWQGASLQIVLEDLSMDWAPSCLIQREVCVRSLKVGAVEIETTPSTEDKKSAGGETALPEVNLPLTLIFDQLQLGRLTLNDSLLLQDLDLTGSVAGDELHLENLSLAREQLQLGISGQVTMSGHWPIKIMVDYRMPLLGDTLEVSLAAQGRIARNVHLEAEVGGPVAGTVSGVVQPLEPGIPAELTARPSHLPIPDSVPPGLHPQDVTIHAVGNLDDGWAVEADAMLPAEPRPMPLTIAGHVTTSGARIDQIALNGDADASLNISGELGWSSGFTAEAKLRWRDFPWQRLFPEVGPVPVELQTLDGSMSLAENAYEGRVKARLSGPAGPSTLSTPFSGDFTQITLPELSIQAGPGAVQGQVALRFADALGWDVALEVDALNPGYWLAALPGKLSGEVRSAGQITDAGPQLRAAVDLSGELRGEEAAIQLEAQAAPEQVHLENLRVRLGENTITGTAQRRGTVGGDKDLAVHLNLKLAQMSQLWPGLAGSLTGEAQVAGWPHQIRASLDLDSNRLSFNDLSLDSLALDASLNQTDVEGRPLSASQLSLLAKVQGIEAAGQELEEVRLEVNGSPADHRVRLQATEARGDIDVTFEGGSEWLRRYAHTLTEGGSAVSQDPAPFWSGRLSSGKLEFAGQEWRLRSPASLVYESGGEVLLGSHCWGWQEAELCAGDQRLWPRPRVRLALENLPTSFLRPLLPPEVRWRATVNGEVTVDLGPVGPRGQIILQAGPGVIAVQRPYGDPGDSPEDTEEADGPGWIEYPYDVLKLTAFLEPDSVIAEARLAGPDLGRFNARVELKNPALAASPTDGPEVQRQVQRLDGSFSLESLDLAILRPFADLQELSGTLNGRGQIGGTLENPTLDGRLSLKNGQLADPRLPLQFENLALQLQFNETGASLEGQWQSGEEGQGQLTGEANWGDGLTATAEITGQQLPARVEPYAEVEVAPDLKVAYNGERLSVTGEVAIPRGSVEIRDLPPQAVSVSEDTVIVGREAKEAPESEPDAGMDLSLDLDVIVGEDELTFSGFGVTGELVGRLHIGDNMDTRGELSLRDGEYEIYGQELTLREANLIFAGPVGQPFLEIEAIRQVDDVTAGIRITGPADRPETDVFAEPAMSEEQALSYLILGRPLESQQDNSIVGTAAISIGLNQAAPLTRAVGERIGVQDLELDTEGSGDNRRIVASGYLTEKLSIRYGVSLFDTGAKLALRYDLTEQLYLEAASGLASSLDIFYSQDFE